MNMHRRRHPGSMLLIVLALGALLGACGAEQPTGATTTTMAGVVTVGTPTAGLTTCVSCHPVTTADWMLTKHANVEPLGNLYSAGNPTLGQITGCSVNCHDSTGDGAGNSFTIGITGNVPRPVVGCESCHSGGQMHADRGGSGLIGFATTTAMVVGTTSTLQASAQFRTCTGCHELLDPVDPAGTLATTATHSALAPTGNAYVITDTHFATPGSFTGSNGANVKDVTGYAMNFSSETVCTDCHNPHKNADINREWAQSAHADKYAAADPLGYFSTAWAHYNWSCDATSTAGGCGTTTPSTRKACQRCHTTGGFSAYADALRTGNVAYAKSINDGAVSLVTYTSNFKPEMLKCSGCHTDNKGTLRNPGPITADYSYPTTTNNITYVVSDASYAYPDVKASNVCMACHTGRESGETVKNLVLNTAPSITTFEILSFINSHYLTAGGTVFTATGFEFPSRNYENPASYRHDQIGTASLPFSGSNGPCVGCHMSRPGGSGDHLFLPVSRSTVTPGHIEGIASEVCIYCHTVSGAGGLEDLINERKEEYIEAVEATMYVLDKRGFYFRGANPYFFQKRTDAGAVSLITGTTVNNDGTVDWVAAGVTAAAAAPDYFKIDNDGAYYKITSVATGSVTITPAYTGTITTGKYTIIKSGSSAAANIRNWLTRAGSGLVTASVSDTDGTGNTTGRYNLGAAFNLNLLEHDPGAYVHNRVYAKRLLYDAIDWADDNLMNYSVGNTLDTLVPAGAIFRAGALKYLLPYGVLGIAAERP